MGLGQHYQLSTMDESCVVIILTSLLSPQKDKQSHKMYLISHVSNSRLLLRLSLFCSYCSQTDIVIRKFSIFLDLLRGGAVEVSNGEVKQCYFNF